MGITESVKRIKPLTLPLYFLKRQNAKVARIKIIREYLRRPGKKMLNLGCGGYLLDGWLNSDLGIYDNKKSIMLDAKKRFPFEDNAFNFVYAEHLIEHLTQALGEQMLAECFRILKRNGIVRISTPDLEFLTDEVYPNRDNKYGWYLDYYNKRFFGLPELSPEMLVNAMFKEWGHSFLKLE